MYGHLQQSLIADGTPVQKGDVIGYLIDQQSNTHTHLEIRSWGTTLENMCTGGAPTPAFGPGYTPPNVYPDSWGSKNPAVFIKNHQIIVPASTAPRTLLPSNLQTQKNISIAIPWYYLFQLASDDRINDVIRLMDQLFLSKPACFQSALATPLGTIQDKYQLSKYWKRYPENVNLKFLRLSSARLVLPNRSNPPPSATEPPNSPSTPVPLSG